VVGLLVLGPERLPQAARTAGLWIGKIKRTVSGMQREINAQLEAEELRQKLEEQQKKFSSGLEKTRKDVEGYIESDGTRKTDRSQRSDDGEGAARGPATPPASAVEHEAVEASTPVDDTAASDDKDATPR
jgi:sec-independent protein translocase protein TatB